MFHCSRNTPLLIFAMLNVASSDLESASASLRSIHLLSWDSIKIPARRYRVPERRVARARLQKRFLERPDALCSIHSVIRAFSFPPSFLAFASLPISLFSTLSSPSFSSRLSALCTERRKMLYAGRSRWILHLQLDGSIR